MDIKTPGVLALSDLMTASQLTSFVRNVEKLGYGSFWFPEGIGRDPFAVAAPPPIGPTIGLSNRISA